MEGREQEQSSFSFHHSCHGSTLIHKLLIDVNRPLRHILLKYALKKNIDDIPELGIQGKEEEGVMEVAEKEIFDTPYDEIITEVNQRLSKKQIDELIDKHRTEMDSIPIVYPIIGVPNGVEVEIHYKLRGYQCQSVLTRTFTNEPVRTAFQTRDYGDYLIINAIGNSENEGIIQTIQCNRFPEERLETFYDINVVNPSNIFCKSTTCNLPNIEYAYEADFNVGLIEFINTPTDRLMTPVDSEDNPVRYTGSSFNMDTKGVLHSYSKESQNRSLLNLIMNGSGIVDWPKDEYERFLGIKSRIHSDKIIINMYASHCLNPQDMKEHGEIGNVIPFITDYTQEWSRMYLDELVTGAEEEIEFRADTVTETEQDLKDKKVYLDLSKKNKEKYEEKQKTFKKPLLDEEPLPKDWTEVTGEFGETMYRNEVTGQGTDYRYEIPHVTGERKSERLDLREKTLDELDDYGMYGRLVEEREETIQSLKGEISGLEDKIDTGQKAVKKAETVRKTARSLYEQAQCGELGEILSTQRSKKPKTGGRKKSKRKKVKRKNKTSKKSNRRKSKRKNIIRNY